jgi:hypothetical protein
MTPPVFLNHNVEIKLLPSPKKELHLVEGHTRLGMLKGLIEKGLLSENSIHKVWVGYKKRFNKLNLQISVATWIL